jgi:hypothetical protein
MCSKFSNQSQLFNYIKSLEISINKAKIAESEDEEKMEELLKTHEKLDKKTTHLEDQVSSLKKKLQNIPNNN